MAAHTMRVAALGRHHSDALNHGMRLTSILNLLCVTIATPAAAVQPLCSDDGPARSDAKQPKAVFTTAQKVGTRVSCPVSGEVFAITDATIHVEYRGKHVYFCCPPCQKRFEKDPEKYLQRAS